MTNLRPDEDIYPVRIYVDRRLWPQTWWFCGYGPREALSAAMEHAKAVLVPGCEVLIKTEGQVMHHILPSDPTYVRAD